MSQPIRVLGLAGSPRRHGNTELLLDRFLAAADQAGAQVEKVVVSQLDIAGCISCGGCWQEGVCVVQDGFQQMNEMLVASDVIALAAPLFFWNVPARVKALIDRGQSQWARKFAVRKPLPPTLAGHKRRRGVFLCVGADARRYFEGAVWTVRSFFQVYETWTIRYLVVNTRNWLPGKSVLVSPSWVQEVNWAERKVHLDLERHVIEQSPEFDPSIPVNREYEIRLYDYYGRPHYWMRI